MITRQDIRELAEFQSAEERACALSFYFQPQTPRNKSHREEAILAKDLVRNALRNTEKNGKNGRTRAVLERILEIAGNLRGNQARAKAIFACGPKNFWREFDLPPCLPQTQLFVNQRFHLKPLATLLSELPPICVAVIDRQRARLFDLRLDELEEREGLFHELLRRGRSYGFRGYEGGHTERRAADDAMHHFKAVADHLKDELEKEPFGKLMIGCQESNWAEFEAHLSAFLRQRLLGHFPAEVVTITQEQIRVKANQMLRQAQQKRQQELIEETLGQAHRNGFGVTGLRRVLRSLELGEVQTLLLGNHFHARAVECTACGHLDPHLVRFCPLCGRETRGLEDVCDAMIPLAIRRDIEVFYAKDDTALDRVGNIAALLRYRADQGTGGRIGVAS